jgi:chorismate mutase
MKTANQELAALREQINVTDETFITVLAERMHLVDLVGQLKADNQMPALDPKRWEEVLETRAEFAATLNLSTELVTEIFEVIHKHALVREQVIAQRRLHSQD